ncbi:MAG: M48 family metalloprotease [Ignavibacteria bacterium]
MSELKSGEKKLTYENVFEYPIETDNIFRLFLLTITGITIIVGNYIPSFLFETESSPLAIFSLTEFYDVDKVFNTPPEVFFSNIFLFLKPIVIQFTFVFLIFGISYYIYKKKPEKIIKGNDLILIKDEKTFEMLETLRIKAGINDHVSYYTNGNIRDFSGQVFGTGKNLYLKAGRGLLKIISLKNYVLFESIILHEFSHIKNKDIPKTYFAESVLKIPFLITLAVSTFVMFFALIKSIASKAFSSELTFLIVMEKAAVYLNLFIQITGLLIILFLLFRMLIRSREYYADLRTASLLSDTSAQIKFFDKSVKKILEQNFIEKLFGYHPSFTLRSDILKDPIKIFKPSVNISFLNNLISYIFITVALVFGVSLLLLIITLAGYSLLYLLKGVLNEILHLYLVYIEMIMGTLAIAVFMLLCGNVLRKSFFSQVDKILITQKYDKSYKKILSELIRLSTFASLGVICGYFLMPLYGFNILNIKNLISIPFVFIITFTGFIILNSFHYFWMDHKINNEYKPDYSVPVLLRLFEGVTIVMIFLSAILSFQFFTTLIIS